MKWKVPKPPQDLVDKYEIRKKAFTTHLNERIMADLAKAELKKRPKYLHNCEFCKNMWEGYVQQPKECPKCRKRLRYEEIPLGKPILKVNVGDTPIKSPI